MRKILGDEAMKAAKKQTQKKLETLTEVVQEISRKRYFLTDSEIYEIWRPFEPYLDMTFDELPLDFDTHVRWIVRDIVRWTGGNTHSNDEEGAIENAKEALYKLIQKFKDV